MMRPTALLITIMMALAIASLMIFDASSTATLEYKQLESLLEDLMTLEDEDFADLFAEIDLIQSDAKYIYGYKCHSLGKQYVGYRGSLDDCRRSCNAMDRMFVNGVERLNYIPHMGVFSTGICDCCGKIM